MNILKKVEAFPGGLVIIPLFLTALLNTFFPNIRQIGGVTEALFCNGTNAVLGLLLFFSGCQLKLSQIKTAFLRGFGLITIKIVTTFLVSKVLMSFFGAKGVFGVSTLAFVIAVASNKPAVYLALVKKYGDEIDESVFGFLCLLSMPMLPVTVLGLSEGVFNIKEILTLLIPFFLGMILANLDEDIRLLMKDGSVMMLPFIGACFGFSINFYSVFSELFGGMILLVFYCVVSMIPALLADVFLLKRPGYAAIASCTIGGTAIAIPLMVVQSMPIHAPFAEAAIAQLAFAMTFSCLITPFLSDWWMKAFNKRKVCEHVN